MESQPVHSFQVASADCDQREEILDIEFVVNGELQEV